MQIATQAAARAQALTRDVGETLVQVGRRLLAEIRLTVDVPRWTQAHTPAERLAALSWPRIGALAVLPLILGLYLAYALTRPDAYPPPDPSAREMAARAEALRNASRPPPPSLVEANKSWKAE